MAKHSSPPAAPQPAAPAEKPPPEGAKASGPPVPVADFLAQEYGALVSLYTHTEDSLASIFNFYLTLLSTIAGGAIVLAQVNGANITAAFPLLGALLVFAVLLGIITQDAIVNKNTDLARYALSLNLLKDYALEKAPAARRRVLYLYYPFTHVAPRHSAPGWLDRTHNRLWWSLPLGMHQLFVSMMNSLALGALAAVIVSGVAPGAVAGWRLLIGCAVVVGLAFLAHSTYAHKIYERRQRRAQITLAGTPVEWGQEPVWRE